LLITLYFSHCRHYFDAAYVDIYYIYLRLFTILLLASIISDYWHCLLDTSLDTRGFYVAFHWLFIYIIIHYLADYYYAITAITIFIIFIDATLLIFILPLLFIIMIYAYVYYVTMLFHYLLRFHFSLRRWYCHYYWGRHYISTTLMLLRFIFILPPRCRVIWLRYLPIVTAIYWFIDVIINTPHFALPFIQSLQDWNTRITAPARFIAWIRLITSLTPALSFWLRHATWHWWYARHFIFIHYAIFCQIIRHYYYFRFHYAITPLPLYLLFITPPFHYYVPPFHWVLRHDYAIIAAITPLRHLHYAIADSGCITAFAIYIMFILHYDIMPLILPLHYWLYLFHAFIDWAAFYLYYYYAITLFSMSIYFASDISTLIDYLSTFIIADITPLSCLRLCHWFIRHATLRINAYYLTLRHIIRLTLLLSWHYAGYAAIFITPADAVDYADATPLPLPLLPLMLFHFLDITLTRLFHWYAITLMTLSDYSLLRHISFSFAFSFFFYFDMFIDFHYFIYFRHACYYCWYIYYWSFHYFDDCIIIFFIFFCFYLSLPLYFIDILPLLLLMLLLLISIILLLYFWCLFLRYISIYFHLPLPPRFIIIRRLLHFGFIIFSSDFDCHYIIFILFMMLTFLFAITDAMLILPQMLMIFIITCHLIFHCHLLFSLILFIVIRLLRYYWYIIILPLLYFINILFIFIDARYIIALTGFSLISFLADCYADAAIYIIWCWLLTLRFIDIDYYMMPYYYITITFHCHCRHFIFYYLFIHYYIYYYWYYYIYFTFHIVYRHYLFSLLFIIYCHWLYSHADYAYLFTPLLLILCTLLLLYIIIFIFIYYEIHFQPLLQLTLIDYYYLIYYYLFIISLIFIIICFIDYYFIYIIIYYMPFHY